MVAVGWYLVAQNGGQPPGGDMVGHAVTAEWLRNLALVGLAGLVRLVLWGPGNRCELPASRSRVDALHSSCPRTDGGCPHRAGGVAAMGSAETGAFSGVFAASPARGSRRGARARCDCRQHASGSIGIPLRNYVLWLLASDDRINAWVVLRELGRMLQATGHVRAGRRHCTSLQFNCRAWNCDCLHRAPCLEWRDVLGGSTVDREGRSRRAGVGELVARAVCCGLGSVGTLGGVVLGFMGSQERHGNPVFFPSWDWRRSGRLAEAQVRRDVLLLRREQG